MMAKAWLVVDQGTNTRQSHIKNSLSYNKRGFAVIGGGTFQVSSRPGAESDQALLATCHLAL